MEGIKYDINKEYDEVVNKVSEKFKYNDELKYVLKRVLPAILEGCSYEDRFLFYKMISHTPIVVINKGTNITRKELEEKYIGDINPHIKEYKNDISEYDKQDADGGFMSEAILNENLEIIGNKQFIYIKSLDLSEELYGNEIEKYKMFKTGINVAHLIHELGHAWNAEKEQYKINGNILTQRCGTAKFKYELVPQENGNYIKKEISREGLMIEESLNTIREIEAVARYLGITKQECEDIYINNVLVDTSIYFGMMHEMIEYLESTPLKKDLKSWRLDGNESSLEKINKIMENTEEYQIRTSDTSVLSEKREIFENPKNEDMKEFFERCKKDFFPDKSNMTPMQLLDNSLTQCYNLKVNQCAFKYDVEGAIATYRDLRWLAEADGYNLINDTKEIIEVEKENEKQD